ncbi:FlgD immunoglobulin-like domain containing protein [Streptomyces sp. SM11]|uniref:FlgD immunoglobulin-like domain containing protein n=1 Tax=Streptomyces sp. SM11 TaxID=565557 RepID=UPI0027E3C8BD|nr:FlgD immunoglobulin-like domain containing protein [Streptomyces sp. SM11]
MNSSAAGPCCTGAAPPRTRRACTTRRRITTTPPRSPASCWATASWPRATPPGICASPPCAPTAPPGPWTRLRASSPGSGPTTPSTSPPRSRPSPLWASPTAPCPPPRRAGGTPRGGSPNRPRPGGSRSTRRSTGEVVRTWTGEEARGTVRVGWDGTSASGDPVPTGGYTWRLTAAPADGTGADATASGTLRVTG